ncbi:MAG: hypothetical protein FWC97_12515, partial [Treponema sp.]|nr:hypothetical protein [Treponema sp.]
MIKYLTIFCIFIIVSQYVFANNIDLLNEYKLLHLDLSNINTWGYKSHFDIKNNKASASINISQGTLKATGNVTDFAIMGHGFLKIRLENDMPGYTRSGNFVIDSYGNFVTLKHNYSLFDNINFPQMFLPNTLKITRDGNVFIKTVDEKGNLTEIDVGKILLHYIPSEYLIHYKDSIYILC